MRCFQRSPQPRPRRLPWLRPRLLPCLLPYLGRRGTTLMEFALVTPAFFLTLVAVFEFALQLTAELALNIGALGGSRYAITGATPTSGTREQAIRNAVLSAAGGMLKDAKLTIATTSYASPAAYAANFLTGNGSVSGPGASGQFVVYTLTYVQDFVTGLPVSSALAASMKTHTATVLVQNEPY